MYILFSQVNKTLPVMVKSCLRDGTELVAFIPEVAKQHDIFAGMIASGIYS